ncbi:hypothetical protein ACFQU2_10660 [Siccirubricoccus deserti]
MDPIRSFDELSVGQDFAFGTMVMPLEEILDFARRYDPQPFHVDPVRAAAGPSAASSPAGCTPWPPPSATCSAPASWSRSRWAARGWSCAGRRRCGQAMRSR